MIGLIIDQIEWREASVLCMAWGAPNHPDCEVTGKIGAWERAAHEGLCRRIYCIVQPPSNWHYEHSPECALILRCS